MNPNLPPQPLPVNPNMNVPPPPEPVRPAPDYLNAVNQSLFSRMSEHSQKMAEGLYEGVYKTPGVNRVAAKLEIGYNQFWADRHEKKAAKQKTKMGVVDMEVQAQDKAKSLIQGQIEKLRSKGLPGVEELELEVKKVEREQAKLADKKSKYQSKFEARENKLKNYTNERDRVADKLIGFYNERLEPLEKDLADLKQEGNRLGVLEQALAASHATEEADMKKTNQDLTDLENALRLIGKSEGAIRRNPAMKVLREQIEKRQATMKAEKEQMAQERAELNTAIARVDKRANPKRDKRDVYARIKQSRPLDMAPPARDRVVDSVGPEVVQGHPRENPASPESEGQEVKKVSEYLQKWNEFLAEKDVLNTTGFKVDADDFIGLVGSVWGPASEVKFSDLKKVMRAYYIFKRVDTARFDQRFNEFYTAKIKQNP